MKLSLRSGRYLPADLKRAKASLISPFAGFSLAGFTPLFSRLVLRDNLQIIHFARGANSLQINQERSSSVSPWLAKHSSSFGNPLNCKRRLGSFPTPCR